METTFFVLAILTVMMLWVTYSAWRTGNELRDVKLLGAIATLLGVGTAITAAM
jgi:hypothetical protein